MSTIPPCTQPFGPEPSVGGSTERIPAPPSHRQRGMRKLAALLLTALIATGFAAVLVPGSAWALGAGKYCLYVAPSGAYGQGHIGWEVQEPGKGYWAGSTEADSGDPVDTWILFSSSETTIHSFFANALTANGKLQHGAGYYTEFRCHSTTTSAVGAAIAQARASTGYNVVWDNCLTKSVSILTTYWGGDHLDSGILRQPNAYFFTYLPTVNWGPEHFL